MSDVNESSLIWMSYVTYEWVIQHDDGALELSGGNFYIWMGHVTFEWAMSHMNKLCNVTMVRWSQVVRIFTYE